MDRERSGLLLAGRGTGVGRTRKHFVEMSPNEGFPTVDRHWKAPGPIAASCRAR